LTVVRLACDHLIGPRFPRTVRYRGNRSSLRARRETRLVMILRIIEPGLSPKVTGGLDRVDAGLLPPGGFIADAVYQPMMDSTERHRELVARLATQGPWLQVA
jgi:hypothetical protein